MKKRIRVFFFIIGIVVLLFVASVELLMKFGFYAPAFSYPGQLSIVLDRRALFKFKPHSREDINNYGYRDGDFTQKKAGKKRILFFGDSFIMGLHVGPLETLPKILERVMGPGFEVYNMGMHGYGPDQSLVRLLDEGVGFNPDLVILSVYPSNDFNDLLLNGIFGLDEKGRLALNSSNAVTSVISKFDALFLFRFLLFKYHINDPGFREMFWRFFGETNNDLTFIKNDDPRLIMRKIGLMRGVLQSFKDTLEQRGIDFLVIILPSYWNIQNTSLFTKQGIDLKKRFTNENIVESLCRERSIKSVNIYPLFLKKGSRPSLYDEEDHHLSVYGHRMVADAVRNRLIHNDPLAVSLPH